LNRAAEFQEKICVHNPQQTLHSKHTFDAQRLARYNEEEYRDHRPCDSIDRYTETWILCTEHTLFYGGSCHDFSNRSKIERAKDACNFYSPSTQFEQKLSINVFFIIINAFSKHLVQC
jgi:hypothetical protein